MPHLVPEDPSFTTATERLVWEALRDGLGPDDVLLANLRLTDTEKDHEADLIVLMPQVGIVVLEVKGGSVWWDATERGWRQSPQRGSSVKRIDPVTQARETKYAVRTYVSRDPRWGRSRAHVGWAHGVVLPHSSVAEDAELPDCPSWSLHGREAMVDLVERVRQNARLGRQGKPAATDDDVEVILEVLAGRFVGGHDVNAEAAEAASTADRLTLEQAAILGVTRLLHRVEVRGGAGSGKTVLALQQARELTRGRGDRPRRRTALLCYSLGLAEHLKRTVAAWPRRERPAFVGTFHEFGAQWGAPDGAREDSDFWETRLPSLMADLAGDLPDGKRYDAVVVDEAQDFADSWWLPVLRSLRDEETGGLYLYSDEHQRIFARFGRPPVTLVPLVLDDNLRNTRQIHEAFGSLAPSRMRSRGGSGPDVRFVPVGADDALGVADDEVDALLDLGWEAGSLALLTTGSRHPVQLERTGHHGQQGYWRTWFDDEDVFYGHVLGCKGLERPAVVLCVNEGGERARSRERLYVGMSRASHQLVVVGDPDVVRAVGGPDVARQLGIDEAQ